MARTYKRDSRGRFAGGGGSSGGRKAGGTGGKARASSSGASSGGRKRNKVGGTATGTFLTRQQGKLAQQKRYRQFSSKATAGRSTKEAYKAAARGARVSQRKAGVSKITVSTAKQKMAPKIGLTSAELGSRMLGEAPRMTKGQGKLPASGDTSTKASRKRKANQAQFEFRSYLKSSAVATARARGVKGPIDKATLDKLFVDAFKNRPRFSTKQGVRPNWRFRNYDILKP